ncbi:MAG: hypothetical protein CMI26_07365 [Opitutae bacterium]|nr:hypothetical protein [Opitutae bacterium]
MNKKILCVDDEESILKGFQLHLRKGFDLYTANSGEEGLRVFDEEGGFAVVLSDMRMPGIDGAAMLSAIKERSTDVVTMLLTGHADFDSAMSAVNDGNVFRMLSKPCPPERLIHSLYAGLRQHELIVGEKVLLEQTLKGAVDALSQALATAKPLFFGRAQRVRRLAGELADRLEEQNKWRIEVASIFSQIASITLPEEISEDVYHKRELSKEVQEIVGRFPEVTEQMLEKIPRLEEVREIITKIDLQPRFELADEKGIRRAASIIKVALDFDHYEELGYEKAIVVRTLRGRETYYDPEVTEALEHLHSIADQKYRIEEVLLKNLGPGMRLAQELRHDSGFLVAPSGTDVDRHFIRVVRNHLACYEESPFPKKILVTVPNA